MISTALVEVPGSSPVSDSSAASSDSCEHSFRGEEMKVLPMEVGGDSFREESNLRRRVSFGIVEERKYPMIMGDHPDCSSGPPITIDWSPFISKVVPVDDYETSKSPRRKTEDLQMGWIQRKQVLRITSGVTDQEMRQAACEAQLVRERRTRTVRRQSLEFVQVPLESLGRKVKRAFGQKR